MKDFYLPVGREQGRFLYQTVRAVGVQRVVEFGSSFGVSTIYLAAGLRDNDGGIVELVEEKAETARRNLTTAGLGDYADTGPAMLEQRSSILAVPSTSCCWTAVRDSTPRSSDAWWNIFELAPW